MNSREEGGRDLSSLLFKIPALQLKGRMTWECTASRMKYCTITVPASASAARPPAIYTAAIMQSGSSHSCPTGTTRAGRWGGGGGASFPGAGSASKFASSPSLRESLGFHSCRRVLGETAGLQTHLAHTGTQDCLFKQNNKGTRAPEARPSSAQGWAQGRPEGTDKPSANDTRSLPNRKCPPSAGH